MNYNKGIHVLIIFTLIFTVFSSFTVGDDFSVTVYTGILFGGPYQTYTSDVPDFSSYSLMANQISSLKISGKGRIALYDEPNFKGKCFEVHDTIDNMRNTRFGDDWVESIKFHEPCPPLPPDPPRQDVILYEHINMQGTRVVLQGDIPDLGKYGFNDKASSIRIKNNIKIALFEDKNYKGNCVSYNKDDYNLGGPNDIGNDKTSSVKYNYDCARTAILTVKNNTGYIVKYSIRGDGISEILEANLSGGLKREFRLPLGARINGQFLKCCWERKCSVDFVLDRDKTLKASEVPGSKEQDHFRIGTCEVE